MVTETEWKTQVTKLTAELPELALSAPGGWRDVQVMHGDDNRTLDVAACWGRLLQKEIEVSSQAPEEAIRCTAETALHAAQMGRRADKIELASILAQARWQYARALLQWIGGNK
jgi:hypothetical protein